MLPELILLSFAFVIASSTVDQTDDRHDFNFQDEFNECFVRHHCSPPELYSRRVDEESNVFLRRSNDLKFPPLNLNSDSSPDSQSSNGPIDAWDWPKYLDLDYSDHEDDEDSNDHTENDQHEQISIDDLIEFCKDDREKATHVQLCLNNLHSTLPPSIDHPTQSHVTTVQQSSDTHAVPRSTDVKLDKFTKKPSCITQVWSKFMRLIGQIPTEAFIGSIQLGITHAVEAYSNQLKGKDADLDYKIVYQEDFPEKGNKKNPPHVYPAFNFEVYAPNIFEHIRKMFGIQSEAFLASLCQPTSLIGMHNPGASRSYFFRSTDGRFLIKSVSRGEARILRDFLQAYYERMHSESLLPKFYGLYCYKRWGGRGKCFVVMNNLFPSNIRIHQKYDLKGSTFGRTASIVEKAKSSPTFKDMDFRPAYPNGIYLDHETYKKTMRMIRRDCQLLERLAIMDYSLLLGIHNLTAIEKPHHQNTNDASDLGYRAWSSNYKGDSLRIFIGIIDIMQNYRLTKKLEHKMKSKVKKQDPMAISVIEPHTYSERFQNFTRGHVFHERHFEAVEGGHRLGDLLAAEDNANS